MMKLTVQFVNLMCVFVSHTFLTLVLKPSLIFLITWVLVIVMSNFAKKKKATLPPFPTPNMVNIKYRI